MTRMEKMADVLQREKDRIAFEENQPKLHARDPQSGVVVTAIGERPDHGTFEATQHRPIERVAENVDGQQKTVTRTVSTWRRMMLNGEISLEMCLEAQEYKDIFDKAMMDPRRASPMDGMPRGGGKYRQPDESTSVFNARARLSEIHHMLNGPESRMSKAMYHVIGMENGFGGREMPLQIRLALKSSLLNALETLVYHRQRPKKKNR